MLKVTFIIPQLCIGGVEINFLRLINSFPAGDITASIAYEKEIDDGSYRSKINPGIKFNQLHSRDGWTLFLELKKYFNLKQPDILIISMYGVAIIALIARFFSKHKPKIIINGSGHFSSILNYSTNYKERFFLKFGAKLTFKFADYFVSQCDEMTVDVIKVLGLSSHKISTINNPVIGKEYEAMLKLPIRHKWLDNKSRSYKVIIMAGRLVPQKGVLEFLDIFKKLVLEIDLNLIIIGEGDLKNNIIQRVNDLKLSDRIDILPNQENYPAFIAASDLFVVNSFYEGLNNMIVESLACGTPVVSTDCPVGPREVLCNGKYGKLSPLLQFDEMQEMILSELQNSTISKPLMKARSMDYTVSKASQNYIKLFNDLVGN